MMFNADDRRFVETAEGAEDIFMGVDQSQVNIVKFQRSITDSFY